MFTIDDACLVLDALTGLDARFVLKTEDAEISRAHMWASVLGDCEVRFALDYVQRAYLSPRRQPMQPGEIRRAWNAERDRRARQFARRHSGAPLPAWMKNQMRQDIERGKRKIRERADTLAAEREQPEHARAC